MIHLILVKKKGYFPQYALEENICIGVIFKYLKCLKQFQPCSLMSSVDNL